MADEETVKPVPYVAFPVLLSCVERMGGDEGIPGRVDKKFLVGMADGTQFQYRQAFRYLGLTTSDDRPTSLLADLVHASLAGRRELFGKIMSTRYPELTALPPDASGDDFFAVLRDRYGIASEIQRKKMRTFFIAAADYAGFPVSPHIRPVKARTSPHQTTGSPQTNTSASQPREALVHDPEVHADPNGQKGNGMPAGRRDIDVSLGDAGSVSVIMNVTRWWDLSEDQFAKLRKLIKEIEALGDSGI
jgi:hypothetical protein